MKGKTNWKGYLAIFAVVVLAMGAYGVATGTLKISGFQLAAVQEQPSGGQPTTPAGSQGTPGFVCNTPSYMVRGNNAYNSSTHTDTNNLVHLAGLTGGFSTWTMGTANTNLAPGNSYDFVPGISTTSFTDNIYGQRFLKPSLPCRDDVAINVVGNAATFTNTSFNQNGQPNTAIGAQSSGTTLTVFERMLAPAQSTYGNPFLRSDTTLNDIGGGSLTHRKAYPNCACITANSTWLDTSKPITSYVTSYTADPQIGGYAVSGSMNKIGIPLISTATTGKQTVCFESPVVTDVQQDQYFTFTTKSTIAAADNFTVTVYPANYFKDQYGNVQWDCNTDGGAAVGSATAVKTTFVV